MATPTDNVPAALIPGTEIPNANTRMYSSPAAPGVGTRITTLMLCNTSGAVETVRLWQTPNIAVANRYAIAMDIQIPGDGWPVIVPQMSGKIMNVDDEIWAFCSAANSVSMHLDGIEMNP